MAPAWSRDSPSTSSYEALKTEKKIHTAAIFRLSATIYTTCTPYIVMCMTLGLCRDTISVNLRSISAMNIITGFPVKCRS